MNVIGSNGGNKYYYFVKYIVEGKEYLVRT